MLYCDVSSHELSVRQRTILFALIKEYCENNASIGSKDLRDKYGFDFSPATIRNELAELRRMGYLYQPFTNSSSTPTESAFKLFIGKLIDGLHVSSTQHQQLKTKIEELQKKQTQMSKEIAKLLADQVGGVAFSLTSKEETIRGMSNLLKHPTEGKVSDILNFLDNLDLYKQHLLPGSVEHNLKKDQKTLHMIIGDENPVLPLGKGYAMISTQVELNNGEKSVIGLITPVQLLTKKKNLQLLEAINQLLKPKKKR